MPIVGVNNEPLYERVIFAYDGTDYRVIKSDTDGNIVIAQKADQNIQARSYGWYSSAWQKNPLTYGYSNTAELYESDTNLPAGTANLDTTAISAGEVWRITYIGIFPVSASMTQIGLYLRRGGTSYPIKIDNTPVTSVWDTFVVDITLKESDSFRLQMANATLNDDLYISMLGYKFDVDQ